MFPSVELRALEVKANEVFQRYAQMYFDQGFLTSVYFFDTDAGFGGAFLIKKRGEESKQVREGGWDSIHVVSAAVEEKRARYRVVSTVFLKMLSHAPSYGELEIAGNLSRTKEETCVLDPKGGEEQHLANLGALIEANETEIRTEMDGIYIKKTKQIVNTGRLCETYMTPDEKLNFQRELQEAQKKKA